MRGDHFHQLAGVAALTLLRQIDPGVEDGRERGFELSQLITIQDLNFHTTLAPEGETIVIQRDGIGLLKNE